ncbi:uncharacterized protein LOC129755727 [Uranotaenia lowii]|uniref:uncharacterized protein LOC129755727 n=1 Tax=Uranotaenia lowii TaxID=190385 RepID=UPI00247AF7BF|nr:uncharacterized protein LOC129755727 [Uranotaenia lowii]
MAFRQVICNSIGLNQISKAPRLMVVPRASMASQKCPNEPPRPCPPCHPGGSSSRSSGSGKQYQIASGYHKIKEMQAKFQVRDNKPVFLKGPMDHTMYLTTCGLALCGLLGSVFVIATVILS